MRLNRSSVVRASWPALNFRKTKATYTSGRPSFTIKGNTGILDLGVAYQPARLTNLQFNHGAKGYVGDREGASVNFIALYAF